MLIKCCTNSIAASVSLERVENERKMTAVTMAIREYMNKIKIFTNKTIMIQSTIYFQLYCIKLDYKIED